MAQQFNYNYYGWHMLVGEKIKNAKIKNKLNDNAN